MRTCETVRRRNGETKKRYATTAPTLRLFDSPAPWKRRIQRVRLVSWLLLFALFPAGCAYYSFTGATLPSHLNTIAIPLAEDNSLSPLASLGDRLTEELIDRFVRQTRLTLETLEGDADAVLTATIDRYTNAPTSITGEEQAARNRVTLTVTVRYVDQVEDKELLQRSFTSFEDYDPTAGGLEQEEQAAEAALRNIVDDIFTAATSNW
jgi:hypothetical protein